MKEEMPDENNEVENGMENGMENEYVFLLHNNVNNYPDDSVEEDRPATGNPPGRWPGDGLGGPAESLAGASEEEGDGQNDSNNTQKRDRKDSSGIRNTSDSLSTADSSEINSQHTMGPGERSGDRPGRRYAGGDKSTTEASNSSIFDRSETAQADGFLDDTRMPTHTPAHRKAAGNRSGLLARGHSNPSTRAEHSAIFAEKDLIHSESLSSGECSYDSAKTEHAHSTTSKDSKIRKGRFVIEQADADTGSPDRLSTIQFRKGRFHVTEAIETEKAYRADLKKVFCLANLQNKQIDILFDMIKNLSGNDKLFQREFNALASSAHEQLEALRRCTK